MTDALTGLTELLQGNAEAGIPPLRALLSAARAGQVDETVELLMAGFAGVLISEDDAALALIDNHVATLRGQGALGWLPYGQEALALAQLVTGRFQDAAANVAEAIELADDLGQDLQVVVLTSISVWLAAVRGDVEAVRKQSELVLGDTRSHRVSSRDWRPGPVPWQTSRPATRPPRSTGWSRCADGPAGRDVTMRAIPDHVEAAVRTGDFDRARRHLPPGWSSGRRTRAPRLLGDSSCAARLWSPEELKHSRRPFVSTDADPTIGPAPNSRTANGCDGIAAGHARRQHLARPVPIKSEPPARRAYRWAG